MAPGVKTMRGFLNIIGSKSFRVFGSFAAGYHTEIAEFTHLDHITTLEQHAENINQTVDNQLYFTGFGGAVTGYQFTQFFERGLFHRADLTVIQLSALGGPFAHVLFEDDSIL